MSLVERFKNSFGRKRFGLLITPVFLGLVAACGGGGGGDGGGGSSSSSTSSSSSSATPSAYAGASEVLVNTGTEYNQYDQQMATLSNGNVVVVWATSLGTVGSIPLAEIRAQIMAPSGAKVGSEIVVSSGTMTSPTSHRHIKPTVTALNDGGFAVAYISNGHYDTFSETDGPIFVRLFSASGVPEGAADTPMLSTPYEGSYVGSNGHQNSPQLIALTGGQFVMAWEESTLSNYGDGDNSTIKAQVYNTNGDELTPAFIVNTSTAGQQSYPGLARLSNGNFVVTWLDFNGSTSDTFRSVIRGQIFGPTGTAVGTEFKVASVNSGNEDTLPHVTGLSDGRFIMVWQELTSGSGTDVYGQIYSATGETLGTAFNLAAVTTLNQVSPVVATLANGHFVALWVDNSGAYGDTSYGITGQAFTSSGVRFGTPFAVNIETSNLQVAPRLTSLQTSGFIATWIDYSGTLGDSNGLSIKSRVFRLN